ncbi:MAG: hypothetical protein CMG64_03885 [Candidatus Marinimicrobia bacterium]|nr:hypothetical protein [Candidatus Neomarinimicrobiota bacterium]|tara:strand:+ start:7009 stop:8559 length:1551 start_codon:yes stop_codon:yes gene_type:complete
MYRLILLVFIQMLFPIDYNQHDVSSNNKNIKFSNSYNDLSDEIILENTIDLDDYIVGPGDVFLFNMISSDGMHNFELEISPLGDVLIPNVGVIYLDQLLLSEAFNKIKLECSKKYSNVKINLTLNKIKKFKVQMIGPIQNSGFFIANPFTTVLSLYNEMIDNDDNKENISIRNIKIYREDKIILVDLLKYSMTGDKEYNPYVKRGDIIEFSIKDRFVFISGGVKTEGNIEYVENENLFDLIHLVGGLSEDADSNYINITSYLDNINKINMTINNISDTKDYILKPNDYINVRKIKEYRRTDFINIDGEVNFPGKYVFDNNMSIGDVINLAGGLTKKADSDMISITNQLINGNPDYELERILLIDPSDRTSSEKSYIKSRKKIIKGLIVSEDKDLTKLIYDYKIEKGDEIFIPLKLNFIEIIGAVKFPGRYPYNPEFSISDYIKESGGKTKNANGKIFVIDNMSNQKTKARLNKSLNNGDILFVEQKEDFDPFTRFKDVMLILGQAAALYAVINTTK